MRMIMAAIGAAALIMASVAIAPQTAQAGSTLVANQTACGVVTVTLTNDSNFPLSPDFGYDDPTETMPWSAIDPHEGPYAGTGPFGDYFESPNGVMFTVASGDTGSRTLTIPEDEGGGSVEVTYRVKAGPEQRDFILPQTIEIETDCEDAPPVVETPAVEDDDEDEKPETWRVCDLTDPGERITILRSDFDNDLHGYIVNDDCMTHFDDEPDQGECLTDIAPTPADGATLVLLSCGNTADFGGTFYATWNGEFYLFEDEVTEATVLLVHRR